MDRKEIARKFAEDVVAKYPDSVKSILLYGSVARGEDKEESDIDLLVLTKNNADLDFPLAELTTKYVLKYGEVPMALAYDYEDFRLKAKHYIFQREVLKEGISLYGS